VAKRINRLNARLIATIAKPGRHADGGGLYLYVDSSGAKRWVFRFRFDSKRRDMGLGGLDSVPLALARERAAEARKTVALGLDPIAGRKTSAATPTFGKFADEFVETKGSGWRSMRHKAQWRMTLTKYAAPLRGKTVDAIKTEDVLEALKPIWTLRPATAQRLRGRIEQVLDAARAVGCRSGENPARWKGHLDQLLPKRQKLVRGHHPAMPYAEVPAFVASLRKKTDAAALALEFLILTATRTGETLGARFSEIDRAAKLWIIPKERMKANREHRAPLSDRALQILAAAGERRDGGSDYVFAGRARGHPLSNMALTMLMRRLGHGAVTVHGFRSAFRDFCGDRTHFPREVAEAALAHAVCDETELAYRRGDALEKRRELMQTWARYLAAEPSRVVKLR
jgi:integrase